MMNGCIKSFTLMLCAAIGLAAYGDEPDPRQEWNIVVKGGSRLGPLVFRKTNDSVTAWRLNVNAEDGWKHLQWTQRPASGPWTPRFVDANEVRWFVNFLLSPTESRFQISFSGRLSKDEGKGVSRIRGGRVPDYTWLATGKTDGHAWFLEPSFVQAKPQTDVNVQAVGQPPAQLAWTASPGTVQPNSFQPGVTIAFQALQAGIYEIKAAAAGEEDTAQLWVFSAHNAIDDAIFEWLDLMRMLPDMRTTEYATVIIKGGGQYVAGPSVTGDNDVVPWQFTWLPQGSYGIRNPDGTLSEIFAIIHTHPRPGDTTPSEDDKDVAREWSSFDHFIGNDYGQVRRGGHTHPDFPEDAAWSVVREAP